MKKQNKKTTKDPSLPSVGLGVNSTSVTDEPAHQNATCKVKLSAVAIKSTILNANNKKTSQFCNVKSRKKTDGAKRERAKNEGTLQERIKV